MRFVRDGQWKKSHGSTGPTPNQDILDRIELEPGAGTLGEAFETRIPQS